ncbi:Uma2 family endonuclease [Actinocorallia sp. B10E7]|uniref:Uma2 family endonuclease n=1 Tax=Actinocorallia sp. B10E7 TaxID=3153558 RepID=UPI00325CC6D4
MATPSQRAIDEIEVPEGFRAELINGEIILSPSSKSLHWLIQFSLFQQFIPLGWMVVAEQTIIHPKHSDEPRPDFLVLSDDEIDPEAHIPGDKGVLVVEVLSTNRGVDLVDKVGVYAAFGIPNYLIIDPFNGECILYQEPHGREYFSRKTIPFGEPVELPEPLSLAVDTSGFRTYRQRNRG